MVKTDLIPCFLCGNGLEIKAFEEYKNSLKTGGVIAAGKNNLQITSLITRLAELRGKLGQLESQHGLIMSFLPEENKDIAIRVLHTAIRQLENQLQAFLQPEN